MAKHVIVPMLERADWIPEAQRVALKEWARAEGVHTAKVWRVEVDAEALSAAVFTYATNERGQCYRDPDRPGYVAMNDPYTIWLRKLPPIALWERD